MLRWACLTECHAHHTARNSARKPGTETEPLRFDESVSASAQRAGVCVCVCVCVCACVCVCVCARVW